jgi:hypothetical protein
LLFWFQCIKESFLSTASIEEGWGLLRVMTPIANSQPHAMNLYDNRIYFIVHANHGETKDLEKGKSKLQVNTDYIILSLILKQRQ